MNGCCFVGGDGVSYNGNRYCWGNWWCCCFVIIIWFFIINWCVDNNVWCFIIFVIDKVRFL